MLRKYEHGQIPRTEDITDDRGVLNCKMTVRVGDGDLDCYLRMIPRKRMFYLVGRQDARIQVIKALVDVQIIELELSVNFLIRTTLERLREENPRNFIKRLYAEFGADWMEYHNNTALYAISYELVHETCASTHNAFGDFVHNAKTIKVRFGIRSLLNLFDTPQSKKAATLNLNTDASISVYRSLEVEEWYGLLDYILDGAL